MIKIRRFEPSDAEAVAGLIARTLQISNLADYSQDYVDQEKALMTPTWCLQKAQETHFYVLTTADQIVAIGAIGSYWGKRDESSLFDIFVDPAYQGQGFGRQIIQTLERDPYFKRARRIEIPASITGVPFYLKMGYGYKNGIEVPDDEGLLRLEKFNKLA